MKKYKNYFKKSLVICLAACLITLLFSCSFTASADSVVLYRTDNFSDDFQNPEVAYLGNSNPLNFSDFSNYNLFLSFDSNYSDSFSVPYVLASASSGSVSGTYLHIPLYAKYGNLFGGQYQSTSSYSVSLPIHFLLIGDTYYPSTSFNIRLTYYSNDDKTKCQSVTFDGSNYKYTSGNRSHFYVDFNFDVSGFVLNNLYRIDFIGYRTVSKAAPIRMAIGDGGFTISSYNQNEKLEDTLTGSHFESPDKSKVDAHDAEEKALFGKIDGSVDELKSFISVSASALIADFSFLNAIQCANNIFQYIWANEWLNKILLFSLLIGCFSFVVGLASSFIASSRGSSRRGGKK